MTFKLVITGTLESAEIPGTDNAYCKYAFVAGREGVQDDWLFEEGWQEGISQLSRRGPGREKLTFNFPLEATYKSTNPHGWPQLVLSFYGYDMLRRDIVQAYGRTHVPIAPGRYVKRVNLFRPLPTSWASQLFGWLTGSRAEFIDPKFPAKTEGREVARVENRGDAIVRFNVLARDMALMGYTEEPGTGGRIMDDGARLLL